MKIDISTILLMQGIIGIIQIIIFYHQYRIIKRYGGIGWWLLWSLTQIIGFIFLLLRAYNWPGPAAVILQNAFLIGATIFTYFGVSRFFNKKENILLPASIYIITLVLLSYFAFIHDDINTRAIIISMSFAAMGLVTARLLYENKTASISKAVNFSCLILVIHSFIMIHRAVLIYFGNSMSTLLNPTFVNYIPYIDATAASILLTFGFVSLINQRLNSEIEESKVHFEAIFNTNPDAIVITRVDDGAIIDANNKFLDLSGLTREEAPNKTSISFWNDAERRSEFLDKIKKEGFCNNFEHTFRSQAGKDVVCLVSASLINLKNSVCLINIIRDITDRKNAEIQLNRYAEELKTANQIKDKFYRIIAHDLRSPFNVLLNLSETLADDAQSLTIDQVKDFSRELNHAVKNQYNLLTDLLDWTKLQTGTMQFSFENFLLHNIIKEEIKELEWIAAGKGIDLLNLIPFETIVYADKRMLKLIVRNLIFNAIKFTERGGLIKLTAESKNDFIEISVEDTGQGIEEENIIKLFSKDAPFTTIGTSNEKGTGLGLILCREIVEMHGGAINVESQQGKGSKFSFTIPFK